MLAGRQNVHMQLDGYMLQGVQPDTASFDWLPHAGALSCATGLADAQDSLKVHK